MFRPSSHPWAVVPLCILAIPAVCQVSSTRRLPKTPPGVQVYSAEFKATNVRTLGDGTTITTEIKEVRARDSQGRNLSVRTRMFPDGSGNESTTGHIVNPVDNTQTTWNSGTKKKEIVRLPSPDQSSGCWRSESGHLSINYGNHAPNAATDIIVALGNIKQYSESPESMHSKTPLLQVQREDLGTTMIQGLEASGIRTARVIPTGQVGNDRPVTTTVEIWRSPEFPLPLREITVDPRSGTRTRELVSLTIGEPDPNLFQPPEGYEVVTEEMHEVACQQ